MAEESVARNQPRNGALGMIADALIAAREAANGFYGAGDFLMGKMPDEINDWSYGNWPMQVPEMSRIPQVKEGRKEQLFDTLMSVPISAGGSTVKKGALAAIDNATQPGLPKRTLKEMGGIRLFHGGKPWVDDTFDLKKVGTGENGILAQGPGFYAADNPKLAEEYLKYARNPVLHELDLADDALIIPNKVMTPEELELYTPYFEALKQSMWDNKVVPPGKHYGDMLWSASRVRSDPALAEAYQRAVREAGVTGFSQDLGAFGNEYSLFDPSKVKKVK